MPSGPAPDLSPDFPPPPRVLVVLYARRPVPGRVKTRLAKDIGNEAAAVLYAALLLAVVRQVRPDSDEPWELAVYATPGEEARKLARDLFGRTLPPGVRVIPQPDGDLGTRLAAAEAHAFAEDFAGVIHIGSDCLLPSGGLLAAASIVRGGEIAIGPALDGGFWLLGLPESIPGLYDDLPWSTEWTLQVLESRLDGRFARRLTSRRDLDTIEDLRALAPDLRMLPEFAPGSPAREALDGALQADL